MNKLQIFYCKKVFRFSPFCGVSEKRLNTPKNLQPSPEKKIIESTKSDKKQKQRLSQPQRFIDKQGEMMYKCLMKKMHDRLYFTIVIILIVDLFYSMSMINSIFFIFSLIFIVQIYFSSILLSRSIDLKYNRCFKMISNYFPSQNNYSDNLVCIQSQQQQMKVFESLLGFKQKKTPILQQRNSILKLLLLINIPNIILLYLFNSLVPEPYMDEYFHYNQFAAYSRNQFAHWDPKITTPPGLYILQRLFAVVLPAELGMMRAINCLFFSNIFVVYVLKVYDFLQPCPGNLTRSLNLALTPTIYFFNFLDYTDAASVSVIAAMFYYNLTKSEWRLGLVSLIAVFIRQNNIIWIAYLIIYRVLGDNKKVILAPKSLPSHLLAIIKIFLTNKMQIFKQSKFQIIAMGIFGLYVYFLNGGRLVFGDHMHHKMTFHPNQLLYLSLFCILNLPITLGEYLSSIGNFFQRIYISRHALAAYLFLLSLSIVFVDQCTLIHPFIRDDNRHFTFYIYRYLLKWSLPKYALCLAYAFSFHFIFKQVVNSELKLMKFILWLGASFGYLCLGELVEFRYFAIPFIMLCFELENKNFNLDVEGVHKQENRYTPREKMIWTILIKSIINLIVIGLFLFYEFDNEYGRGRYMW